MPTSDKELAAKAAEVEKLRAQVAAEERTLSDRQQELSNDVTAKELDREKATLQERLAALKGQNKVTAVREGAAAVVDPEAYAAKVEEARMNALAEAGELPTAEDVAEKKGK